MNRTLFLESGYILTSAELVSFDTTEARALNNSKFQAPELRTRFRNWNNGGIKNDIRRIPKTQKAAFS